MSNKTENFLLIVMWILFLSFVNAAGRLEGRYIPVMDNVEVELVDRSDEKSDIWISFTKERQCDYQGIEFTMIDKVDKVEYATKLSSVFEGKEFHRTIGDHRSGNWVINAPAHELENLEFTLSHDCHAGFSTVSTFRLVDGVAVRQ